MWVQLAALAFLGSQYFKAKQATPAATGTQAQNFLGPPAQKPNAIFKINQTQPPIIPVGEAMYRPPVYQITDSPTPIVSPPGMIDSNLVLIKPIISPPEVALPPWTPSPVTLNNPITSPLAPAGFTEIAPGISVPTSTLGDNRVPGIIRLGDTLQ